MFTAFADWEYGRLEFVYEDGKATYDFYSKTGKQSFERIDAELADPFFIRVLNALGSRGWEAIHISGKSAILKRQLGDGLIHPKDLPKRR